MCRRVAFAILCVATVSCADPTAPSSPPPLSSVTLLAPGPYLVSVRALPGFDGCANVRPGTLSARAVRVQLSRDGDEWVGTPGAISEGFALRFRELSTGAVRGTMRGTMITAAAPDGEIDLGATFGSSTGTPALVTGAIVGELRLVWGRAEGVIAFIDRQPGEPLTCSVAEWTMSPALF